MAIQQLTNWQLSSGLSLTPDLSGQWLFQHRKYAQEKSQRRHLWAPGKVMRALFRSVLLLSLLIIQIVLWYDKWNLYEQTPKNFLKCKNNFSLK